LEYWHQWTSKIQLPAEYKDLVMRSLITLKACTYRPSGAIVAAPTFGLPETPGGGRNWDYRFTWVRDSVLTLNALLRAGLFDEGRAFGDWFQDAIGGAPDQLQIMYGIRGERRLTEVEIPWLEGHGGAKPVRIGNGAYDQFQLDVLGELAHVIFAFGKAAGGLRPLGREAMKAVAERTAAVWQETDHGIWEMRGPTRSFTASKVAAWTAIDRWVRTIELLGLDEDTQPWVELRDKIHAEVCEKGFDPVRNTFTQYYGSRDLDASLLFIPASGFLPATDPRIVGTVKAIEEDLMPDGLVLRYRTDISDDGLSGEEGVFLACSFWLASTYHLMGRHADARRLFERVANLKNDVGLLAEEYLPGAKKQIGNFPQAFSHLALINCAYTLVEDQAPPQHPAA
jgi:GH15 family glucan-1,4-alpha-glucosidase